MGKPPFFMGKSTISHAQSRGPACCALPPSWWRASLMRPSWHRSRPRATAWMGHISKCENYMKAPDVPHFQGEIPYFFRLEHGFWRSFEARVLFLWIETTCMNQLCIIISQQLENHPVEPLSRVLFLSCIHLEGLKDFPIWQWQAHFRGTSSESSGSIQLI